MGDKITAKDTMKELACPASWVCGGVHTGRRQAIGEEIRLIRIIRQAVVWQGNEVAKTAAGNETCLHDCPAEGNRTSTTKSISIILTHAAHSKFRCSAMAGRAVHRVERDWFRCNEPPPESLRRSPRRSITAKTCAYRQGPVQIVDGHINYNRRGHGRIPVKNGEFYFHRNEHALQVRTPPSREASWSTLVLRTILVRCRNGSVLPKRPEDHDTRFEVPGST